MFDGIREFVSVSTLGSFSAAANELKVSTAHVSRQIKALESRLGIKLFLRSTRSVEITEQGQRYYQQCLKVIDAMQEANDEAKQEHVNMSGAIKIAAGGDYSELVIGPIISKFAKRHPAVKIEINFSDKNQNLVENNYDFAIRYGELIDSSNIAKKISVRQLRFAASQSYLDEKGVPSHPKELRNHRCIVSGNRQWRYLENEKTRTTTVDPIWKSNSAKLIIKHAIDGNGICYLPSDTIKHYDTESNLTSVLSDFAYKNMPTYLVYPNRDYVPKRVGLLMDFIIQATSALAKDV
jgi:DNA-binding transcriptional LysR family regulator